MIKKISLLGLFAAVLLINGCSKNEPQASSDMNKVNEEIKPVPVVNENVSTEKKIVKIQTSMGDIIVELNEEKAPITVKNFLGYVESGFYDGTIFHRVIEGFMIQGGGFTEDLVQKRTNAPIKIESVNGLKNDRGTIAMARTDIPDSATSQFFINHVDNDGLNYAGSSNPGYAVFGKVLEGMDVVDKIASVDVTIRKSMQKVPVNTVKIISVKVVSE